MEDSGIPRNLLTRTAAGQQRAAVIVPTTPTPLVDLVSKPPPPTIPPTSAEEINQPRPPILSPLDDVVTPTPPPPQRALSTSGKKKSLEKVSEISLLTSPTLGERKKNSGDSLAQSSGANTTSNSTIRKRESLEKLSHANTTRQQQPQSDTPPRQTSPSPSTTASPPFGKRSSSMNSLVSATTSSIDSTTSSTQPPQLPPPPQHIRSASDNHLNIKPSATPPVVTTRTRPEIALQWGMVEEYAPAEFDSDASSMTSHGSRVFSSSVDDNDDNDEDDGWGWFPPNDQDNGATTTTGTTKLPAPVLSTTSTRTKTQPAAAAATTQSPQPSKPKRSSLLVRMVSTKPASNSIDSTASGDGTNDHFTTKSSSSSSDRGPSLLLLGSALWPERRKPHRPTKDDDKTAATFLDEQIELANALKLPLAQSSAIIFGRGCALGWAMRFLPNLLLGNARKHWGESLRSGLFLGSSMAMFHVLVMGAQQDQQNDVAPSSPPTSIRLNHISCAAVLSPLLFILPQDSRIAISLFMAARATEAFLNGSVLSRIPLELAVSKYLFAIGNAQVVYCWLFHRQALPAELLKFLDSTSVFSGSLGDDLFGSGGDIVAKLELILSQGNNWFHHLTQSVKRLFGLSGFVELVASDIFSATSLFSPVLFDSTRGGKSLTRAVESLSVLTADVALSGLALVGLSRLLKRSEPSNAWYAGFLAGLCAIQMGSREEKHRVELALFMLTQAARSIHRIAVMRNVLPEGKYGEVLIYFASLIVLLKAATEPRRGNNQPGLGPSSSSRSTRKRTLILGAMFREVVHKAVVAG